LKSLKNLQTKIKPPNNRHDPNAVPTLSDIFVDSLKFVKLQDGSESIKLNRLADKIFDAKDDVQLEDAEFELLKIKVNENGAGYFAWAHGQAMEKIIQSEVANG